MASGLLIMERDITACRGHPARIAIQTRQAHGDRQIGEREDDVEMGGRGEDAGATVSQHGGRLLVSGEPERPAQARADIRHQPAEPAVERVTCRAGLVCFHLSSP